MQRISVNAGAEASNYLAIRATLIRSGTNLRRWSAERGINYQTAYQAATLTRRGIKTMAVRHQLEEYCARFAR